MLKYSKNFVSIRRKVMVSNKNKYVIPVWDGLNIVFCILAVLKTIVFLILFILSCFNFKDENLRSVILGFCGVFASLSSAFFIAFFVRWHDLKKKQSIEKSALKLMRPYFSSIYCIIDSFYPQLKAFAKINTNDTLSYPKERIYYKRINDSTHRSFIDFDVEFSKSKHELDSKIAECERSPLMYQCNGAVSDLLTRLKTNGLTRNLKDLINFKTPPQLTMLASLYDNFQEYAFFYEEFSFLSEIEKHDNLELLNNREKEEYMQIIEVCSQKAKECFSNHPSSSNAYNNKRIQ